MFFVTGWPCESSVCCVKLLQCCVCKFRLNKGFHRYKLVSSILMYFLLLEFCFTFWIFKLFLSIQLELSRGRFSKYVLPTGGINFLVYTAQTHLTAGVHAPCLVDLLLGFTCIWPVYQSSQSIGVQIPLMVLNNRMCFLCFLSPTVRHIEEADVWDCYRHFCQSINNNQDGAKVSRSRKHMSGSSSDLSSEKSGYIGIIDNVMMPQLKTSVFVYLGLVWREFGSCSVCGSVRWLWATLCTKRELLQHLIRWLEGGMCRPWDVHSWPSILVVCFLIFNMRCVQWLLSTGVFKMWKYEIVLVPYRDPFLIF